MNPNTGARCRRKPCVDYRYCTQHLINVVHLYIGKNSRNLRRRRRQVEGRGLYAVSGSGDLKHAGIDNGIPNVDRGIVVFRDGDLIDVYGGEMMSKNRIDRRYRDPNAVATYAITSRKHGVDAYCASTAAAYANDPYNPDLPDPYNTARARANVEMHYDRANRTFEMYATKDIRHGEEILLHYGREYWT